MCCSCNVNIDLSYVILPQHSGEQVEADGCPEHGISWRHEPLSWSDSLSLLADIGERQMLSLSLSTDRD